MGWQDVRNLSGGNRCGSLGLLAQYVATPPDRFDVVRAARCTSEFFSQLADNDVDDLHLWLVHTAIEIAQEHFLGQRRSLAQRQELIKRARAALSAYPADAPRSAYPHSRSAVRPSQDVGIACTILPRGYQS